MEPLFLQPAFQKKIWGGRKLQERFGYHIPDGQVGECWAISAHPHGLSTVKNGSFAKQDLAQLWQEQPELFGYPQGKVFPLLTKILDAEASLSVQVHPDNAYAKAHEGELGKTECWYIIDAQPGAYLIYGHNAQTKSELQALIDSGDWGHLLKKMPVKTGDFVFVPSGCVHALNQGIIALETQQSSDTTYRLYDYDRIEQATGQKRQLHLKQALDTITVPFQMPQLNQTVQQFGASSITTYVKPPVSPYFAVWGLQVQHDALSLQHQLGAYTLCSVIAGTGQLVIAGKTYELRLGDHFIVPAPIDTWQFQGENLQVIASEAIDNVD